MTKYEEKSLAVAKRQAKALERIADALEGKPKAVEPEEIDLSGVITWKDAIHVMRTTCVEADECGPGCPMYEWCQTMNKDGSAPSKWEPFENDEEGEE